MSDTTIELTQAEGEFITAVRKHGMRLLFEPAADADHADRFGLIGMEYVGAFLQVDADSRIVASAYGVVLNAKFAQLNDPQDIAYPARIAKQEDGGYLITFRDLPEGIGQADTMKEAVEEAERIIETVSANYLRERVIMPLPSEAEPEEHAIAVRIPLAFAIQQSNYEVVAAKEKELFDKVRGACATE